MITVDALADRLPTRTQVTRFFRGAARWATSNVLALGLVNNPAAVSGNEIALSTPTPILAPAPDFRPVVDAALPAPALSETPTAAPTKESTDKSGQLKSLVKLLDTHISLDHSPNVKFLLDYVVVSHPKTQGLFFSSLYSDQLKHPEDRHSLLQNNLWFTEGIGTTVPAVTYFQERDETGKLVREELRAYFDSEGRIYQPIAHPNQLTGLSFAPDPMTNFNEGQMKALARKALQNPPEENSWTAEHKPGLFGGLKASLSHREQKSGYESGLFVDSTGRITIVKNYNRAT